MPSTYTGVAANVSLAAGVTETLPADGEAANVASVNGALQKVADYLEALRQIIGSAVGSITSGATVTFAGGAEVEITSFLAADTNNFGSGVTANTANGRITVSRAGTYRIDAWASMRHTVASSQIHITARKNGVLAASGSMDFTGEAQSASSTSVGTYLGAIYIDTAAAADYYSVWVSSPINGTGTIFRGALIVTRIG